MKFKEVGTKLDDKIRVLIGAAVAFVAKCKPWFNHFVEEAQKSGINEQEILEAVDLAKMVRKGAMNQMDQYFLKRFNSAIKIIDDDSARGCGCSQ